MRGLFYVLHDIILGYNIDMKNNICNGTSGTIYGLGFVGALVYFLQHSAGFWPSILAILKAFVWPAMLVYNLLKFLQI